MVTLNNFKISLKNVEQIIIINNTPQTSYSFLLRTIQNKIICKSHDATNMMESELIWENIKKAQLSLFSSKKTKAIRLRALRTFSGDMSVRQRFYGMLKIGTQLNELLQKTATTIIATETINGIYADMCLNTF